MAMEILMPMPRWCGKELSDDDGDANGGGGHDHRGHDRGVDEATVTRMRLADNSSLTLVTRYLVKRAMRGLNVETSMVSVLRPTWSQC